MMSHSVQKPQYCNGNWYDAIVNQNDKILKNKLPYRRIVCINESNRGCGSLVQEMFESEKHLLVQMIILEEIIPKTTYIILAPQTSGLTAVVLVLIMIQQEIGEQFQMYMAALLYDGNQNIFPTLYIHQGMYDDSCYEWNHTLQFTDKLYLEGTCMTKPGNRHAIADKIDHGKDTTFYRQLQNEPKDDQEICSTSLISLESQKEKVRGLHQPQLPENTTTTTPVQSYDEAPQSPKNRIKDKARFRKGFGRNFVQLYLFIFIFLSSIVTSDSQMFEKSKAHLNSTSMTFTACSVAVKECPNGERDARNHVFCIRGFESSECPKGFTYFCSRHNSGYLVEGCFERNICAKGTSNDIGFDQVTGEATLICSICSEHKIQTTVHDSVNRFRPGCDDFGVSMDLLRDKMMKKVYDGHPTEPDQYICDTSLGYSETKGITLCNVSNYCQCSKQTVCTKEDYPDLLPNGSCDRRCSVNRDIWTNFSCNRYDDLQDNTSLPVNAVNESKEVTASTYQNGKIAAVQDALWPQIVFPVLAVAILVVGIGVCLLCKYRSFHRVPDEEKGEIAADSGRSENSFWSRFTRIKKSITNMGTTNIIIKGNNNTITFTKDKDPTEMDMEEPDDETNVKLLEGQEDYSHQMQNLKFG